jgi:hypothetical protein
MLSEEIEPVSIRRVAPREVSEASLATSARAPTPLGTLHKARRYVKVVMWRGETRRGRAGQAFEFGEPDVVDGTTANSLATDYHGPRQDDQVVKTKPRTRSCLRVLDQSLGPT